MSTAESELCAAVKAALQGRREGGRETWDCVWVDPTLGCLSNDGLGQPQRIGQGEARRHAEPVDTGGVQVRKVRHEKVGTNVNPADLKALPGPKIEQLTEIMGYDFVGHHLRVAWRETGEITAALGIKHAHDVTDDWRCHCEQTRSTIEASSSGHSQWQRAWAGRRLPRWSSTNRTAGVRWPQ